ncbi:cobalt-precorrin-5B (C(1))-methyltransferase CbiD [Thermincola ferriacetica]
MGEISKKSHNIALRCGITTGASAAAAAGAATALLSRGERLEFYKVVNPNGQELVVKIKSVRLDGDKATGIVVKDGGDDPDTTHGLDIVAEVSFIPGTGVEITAGTGVGTVTKPGLQVPVGQPAINPVPRQMITEAVKRELPEGFGARVCISIPMGEEVARRTLNPKLGIVNGLSVLGTTGIVEPMSEDSFKRSLAPQISMAKANGFRTVCLTPGRLGEKWAVEKLGLPVDCVAQMSNFVGYMLEVCVKEGIEGVILVGHHSKLTKIAAGCFHTHNRVADARLETLAAHAALMGASRQVVDRLMRSNTAEEGYQVLKENNLLGVFNRIADAASRRAAEYVYGDLQVGTVLFTMQGDIVAYDANARELGKKLGWKIC